MRKLIAAVVAGFILVAGVAIVVSITSDSTIDVVDTHTMTTTGTTKPAHRGLKSFVAKTNDSAFWIYWRRTGSLIGGIAMADVVTRHPLHSATTGVSFTGTVSGGRVLIHFPGQGLDYMTSLRGRIDSRGFTATPDGSITPIRFRAASIHAYADAENHLIGLS